MPSLMEENFKMTHSDEYDPLITNQEGNSDVNPDAVPYEEALKQTGYGRFHYKVLALCGWAVSSDAIEVLSVSFLLPAASCDLDIGSTDKGWLNAIVFIGMLLGGYFWGSLADHQGRRSILMWSLTVNGLGVLASSVVQTFWAFLLCRFISGIGVGGSIPVIFSYFTEFQPKEKRGMMISALATFWMCGNIIAAGKIAHLELISDC
ncbi:SV2 [Mytilus coruscus]|uniref:SV2 n=1 Tax=Mytilus coruscus TaxID=42192 RepID=A0A6J8D7F5_MYTCO|nr:SV2 [Mytilus coruscus]